MHNMYICPSNHRPNISTFILLAINGICEIVVDRADNMQSELFSVTEEVKIYRPQNVAFWTT